MIPIFFNFGTFTVFGHSIHIAIYSYGVMVALGLIGGYLVIAWECRRRGITTEYASSLVVWAAIAGLVGARIWDVFDSPQMYLQHPISIIFSSAGFVWYGGFVGGFLAVWLIARHFGVRFLTTADMVAPAILVGHAIGRMGCLLSGDGGWGVPTKMPWGMAFPHAIVGWNSQTVLRLNAHDQLVSGFYPGVRVQPTPIFEAVLYVAIAAFLLWALRRRNWREGVVFYLFLVLSGGARFLVEFWRINPRVLWGLSEYQLFSILMMVAGTAALIWAWNKRTAEPETEVAEKSAVSA